jgi:hypothetical protein
MRPTLFSSLILYFFFNIATSQDSLSSQGAAATTTSVSLTPEMSASAVSSLYSVLATSSPQQPGNGEFSEKVPSLLQAIGLTISQDHRQEMLDRRQGRVLATRMLEHLELTLDPSHFREVQ